MTIPPDTAEKLKDRMWRLTSGKLYKIQTADGQGIIPFIPRPEQVQVIQAIVMDKKRRILIPKARRLGMSTTLGVIAADSLLWRKTWQGSLIDANAADASKKLDTIVKTALENLPDWLQPRVKFIKSNDSQITIDVEGTGERSFYAGMNARGGSNDLLWVSEWGVIQFEDPKRSAKIRAGALPSARHGVAVVETTWAGGKGGDVWELLEPTLTGQANDWAFLFFPWWVDPRNVSDDAVIDSMAEKYFAKIAPRLAKEGINLSERQKRWWSAERREQGIFMQRENPTFLDECWSAPITGAVYREEMERAMAEGRIAKVPYYEGAPVFTVWDLGAPQNMCVWYFQIVGREIRVIDCDVGDIMGTLTQRVGKMNQRYTFAKHFLPHDAMQTERSGKTFFSALVEAGMASNLISVIPQTADIWIGINYLKELFPNMSFDAEKCARGLDGLGAYRMKTIGVGALTSTEPYHDWASHIADPARYIAEAHRAGLFSFKHTEAKPRPDWYGGMRRRGAVPMRVSA